MNIILIIYKKKQLFNIKSHFILKKVKNILYFDINDSINFIKNNKYKNIMFYGQGHSGFFHLPILKFIKENGNFQNNIIFFSFDFWIHNINYFYPYLDFLFKAKYHKVICFSNNIKQLNFFHNFNYENYKENIIFNNIWCCYDKSFCKYNNNPIKKLLISGSSNKNHYSERFILSKLKSRFNKIDQYRYNKNDLTKYNNNYNLILNKYFACFSSSVYVKRKNNVNDNKYYNIHIILLKVFEILSCGSLLVMPKKEEEYIKKIGLKNNIYCYLIDFNKNLINQINHIFNNIKKFDLIRKNGQKHAKEKLTSDIKFEEIKKYFKKF